MPAATMGANQNFLSDVSKSEPERKKKCIRKKDIKTFVYTNFNYVLPLMTRLVCLRLPREKRGALMIGGCQRLRVHFDHPVWFGRQRESFMETMRDNLSVGSAGLTEGPLKSISS